MSIQAIVEQPPESDDKRGAPRWRIRLELPDGPDRANVVIHDISTDGMLIETRSTLEVGQSVALSLPEADRVVARIVWQNAPLFGCRFDRPLSQAAVSAARLRNPTRGTAHPPVEPPSEPSATKAPEGLPERLHRLRREQGLSRKAMAERTGFSKPTIWGWETGRTTPRTDNLRILAGIFGLTEHQLLLGEQSPAAPHRQPADPDSPAPSLGVLIDQARNRIAEAAGVPKSHVHIQIEF